MEEVYATAGAKSGVPNLMQHPFPVCTNSLQTRPKLCAVLAAVLAMQICCADNPVVIDVAKHAHMCRESPAFYLNQKAVENKL